MTRRFLSAILITTLLAAGVWNLMRGESRQTDTRAPVPDESLSPQTPADNEPDSPFAIDSSREPSEADGGASAGDKARATGSSVSADPDSVPAVDVTALQPPLDEQALGLLVQRLNNDPALLQQLMDEFRQEADPARKQWLASVLGEVGGEQITLLASELIFSGDDASRSLGMNLLQEIQPGNAQARDIVSGMLASEVEPDVLVDALTALVSPGDVDAQSRAYLSDQIAWLTTHQDDTVRGISLDILSRWTDDGRYTDVLLAGLDDASDRVRTAAAYALVEHEEHTPAMVERLFSAVRDDTEPLGVKRAAILALRSAPLSEAQLAELQALEKRLNTVRR